MLSRPTQALMMFMFTPYIFMPSVLAFMSCKHIYLIHIRYDTLMTLAMFCLLFVDFGFLYFDPWTTESLVSMVASTYPSMVNKSLTFMDILRSLQDLSLHSPHLYNMTPVTFSSLAILSCLAGFQTQFPITWSFSIFTLLSQSQLVVLRNFAKAQFFTVVSLDSLVSLGLYILFPKKSISSCSEVLSFSNYIIYIAYGNKSNMDCLSMSLCRIKFVY